MAVRSGGPRKNAKDLMRACGIPPWLRQAVPMIYRNDELQAVGDWLPGAEFASWLSKIGLSYRWQPEHPLLRKLQSVSVQCLSTSEFKNEQIQG